MSSRRRNNAAWWAGNALLIAGAAALGIWVYSCLDLAVWQSWQNRLFDHRRATQQSAQQQVHIEDGGIVGRLTIPRLHVRAIVREGDSDRALKIALGHIPGTALPGQRGNVGIAGHRDTLFRALAGVAANDDIAFETAYGNYAYRVESTQIVKPEDVEVLAPGSSRELTLVTCYPFDYIGSAPDRFIVKARLVSEERAENEIHDKPIPTPVSHALPRKTAGHPQQQQIAFNVPVGHSRELIPGKVWFGLSAANDSSQTVSGWVWVLPDRQTIWLRDAERRAPVVFYQDGGRRELVIAGVMRGSVRGYLYRTN
jgi:sortase A